MSDLQAEIERQTRGRAPGTVTELILDKCKATKVTGLDEFSNLQSISLNGVGLTTLEGFPTLPKLTKLELSDNKISGGLDELMGAALISLQSLNLSGNRISTLEALAPLDALPNLKSLDLFNCAVTEVEGYREEIFKMIPSLKYLDGFDVNDDEKPLEESEDDDDGEEDDLLEESEVEGDGEFDDLGEEEDGEEEGEEAGSNPPPMNGKLYDDFDEEDGEESEQFGEEEDFEEYSEDGNLEAELGGEGEEGLSSVDDDELDGEEDDLEDEEEEDASRKKRRLG